MLSGKLISKRKERKILTNYLHKEVLVFIPGFAFINICKCLPFQWMEYKVITPNHMEVPASCSSQELDIARPWLPQGPPEALHLQGGWP